MQAVASPALGIDMDPSHIYRAGENPVDAIQAVIGRVKHVHIRDCKGRQQGPGKPEDQANGRGDIDLVGYIRALQAGGYAGPLDLEANLAAAGVGLGALLDSELGVLADHSPHGLTVPHRASRTRPPRGSTPPVPC